jgi:FlaA1/EpsC-like NDP-sugar epimerase
MGGRLSLQIHRDSEKNWIFSVCATDDDDGSLMIQSLIRSLRGFRKHVLPVGGGIAPVLQASSSIQNVEIGDLLGRETVNLDTPELQRFLAGKVILITGAGGSIGSEICRQIMRFCPAALILVERAENNLFEIDRELREKWLGSTIIPYVADICDEPRIRGIFSEHQPQVVLHCAAHKHVPMMERNPGEAIKNNVFGTKTIADISAELGVDAFVMVSTDKAVKPSSVMGAAKRFAELYIQSKNQSQAEARGPARGTRFVTVRFGNVLGSSGSVVPIFKKQITAGGPVTVTHPEMRRYFMTIPEASQLVLQAGAIGQGGEIFVLDMGKPIRILDLARELIRRSGLRVDEDIAIEFTGIRPGEKLYEELAGHLEETRPTSHSRIRVWQLPVAKVEQIRRGLEILGEAVDGTREQAIQALARCVNEYRPEGIEASKANAGVEITAGEELSITPSLRLAADEDDAAIRAA